MSHYVEGDNKESKAGIHHDEIAKTMIRIPAHLVSVS